MKSNLLLISIFLSGIGLLFHEADGLCFDLVKQYYECRYLKMKYYFDDYFYFFDEFYAPDPDVPNNLVNDSIYQNLTSYTFDQGMSLIQRIFQETDNCTSQFCRCVSHGYIDDTLYYGRQSILFRNATNFNQMKTIVADFGNKFRSQLLPLDEIHQDLNYEEHELPSLAKFCVELEFTYTRVDFYYKNISACNTFNSTVSVFSSYSDIYKYY